jgi:hypothetical protein
VLKSPEFRADLVVVLTLRDGAPVEGIVVEAQLARKARKRFVWPLYAAALRARFEIPVTVLILTVNDAIARWASRTIAIGGGNTFTPLVIRLSRIPAVTDPARALDELELAVLSVMAHGRDKNVRRAARIVAAAWEATELTVRLDPKRAEMYFDLMAASMSENVRRELRTMDPDKYEYQSRFARRYVAQGWRKGKAEGKAEGMAEGTVEGRAALIVRQLTLRFGAPDEAQMARIKAASIEELDAIGERLLTAATLQEALQSD